MSLTREAARHDSTLPKAFGLLAAVVAAALVPWSAASLGVAAGDDAAAPAGDFIGWTVSLLLGRAVWPGPWASLFAGLLTLTVLVAAVLIVRWLMADPGVGGESMEHKATNLLASPAELRDLQAPAATEKARRLRPAGIGNCEGDIGLCLGTPVGQKRSIYASHEDTVILLAAPRVGKTTGYVIPWMVDHPGPVVTTSNKRDVWDATADVRAEAGQVWRFDPQGIVDASPRMWFNPLRGITTITEAQILASHFAVSVASADSKRDQYFDGEGEQLVARLLLAAAHKTGGTLVDVWRWVHAPDNEEPVDLLNEAGLEVTKLGLAAQAELPPKQRDGVYGTGRAFLRCLENQHVLAWVTPPADNQLPEFDPHAFVCSAGDTLYAISRETGPDAGPLVAAISQSVFDAGEHHSASRPAGRLDPPVLSVLDEAANVVKLRHLPANYSHFGSRGLPVVTVLQNMAQGRGVWGQDGMETLWNASTVRMYAGGGSDPQWLEQQSTIVGSWYRPTTTRNSDPRGPASRTHSEQKEAIFTAAELAQLPMGQALVQVSQHPPTIVHTRPWMQGPHARKINSSISNNQPAGEAR